MQAPLPDGGAARENEADDRTAARTGDSVPGSGTGEKKIGSPALDHCRAFHPGHPETSGRANFHVREWLIARRIVHGRSSRAQVSSAAGAGTRSRPKTWATRMPMR